MLKNRLERVDTDTVEEYTKQVLSDVEIIDLIECELNDPSTKVVDMNTVNNIHKELLRENGTEEHLRHLKHLSEIKNPANQSIFAVKMLM